MFEFRRSPGEILKRILKEIYEEIRGNMSERTRETFTRIVKKKTWKELLSESFVECLTDPQKNFRNPGKKYLNKSHEEFFKHSLEEYLEEILKIFLEELLGESLKNFRGVFLKKSQ